MYFSTFASTGGGVQNLTDADVSIKTKFMLLSSGAAILNSAGLAPAADAFIITSTPGNIISPNTNFKVKTNGTVYCREVFVQVADFPDYVFKNDYKLMSLDKLENYIIANKHLPNVPSASEIERNGASIGELNKIQMEKIEELTLYIIELKKEVETLKTKVK